MQTLTVEEATTLLDVTVTPDDAVGTINLLFNDKVHSIMPESYPSPKDGRPCYAFHATVGNWVVQLDKWKSLDNIDGFHLLSARCPIKHYPDSTELAMCFGHMFAGREVQYRKRTLIMDDAEEVEHHHISVDFCYLRDSALCKEAAKAPLEELTPTMAYQFALALDQITWLEAHGDLEDYSLQWITEAECEGVQ